MILKDHKRPDGRAIDQIRPLAAEVDLLPRVHGSAMFTRGQTQILYGWHMEIRLRLEVPGEELFLPAHHVRSHVFQVLLTFLFHLQNMKGNYNGAYIA